MPTANVIVFIYKLIDPDSMEVRYIGQTKRPAERLTQHCRPVEYLDSKLTRWLVRLRHQGQKPIMTVITETTAQTADDLEQYWIRYYRRRGCRLLNSRAEIPYSRTKRLPKPKSP